MGWETFGNKVLSTYIYQVFLQEQCLYNWIPGNKTYSQIQTGSNLFHNFWFANTTTGLVGCMHLVYRTLHSLDLQNVFLAETWMLILKVHHLIFQNQVLMGLYMPNLSVHCQKHDLGQYMDLILVPMKVLDQYGYNRSLVSPKRQSRTDSVYVMRTNKRGGGCTIQDLRYFSIFASIF